MTGSSNTANVQIHEKEIMPEPQETWDPTGPVKRKLQFSIGKMLLWTAVVAGGLTVVKVSETNSNIDPIPQVLSLSLYTVVVCGLWTLIKNLKSFDFWFPAGMSVFLPVFLLLYLVVIPRTPGQIGDPLMEGISAAILCLGVPYGIGLLVLIIRTTSKRGFSLAMLVFYAGCWLWWMACAAIVWLGASGSLL